MKMQPHKFEIFQKNNCLEFFHFFKLFLLPKHILMINIGIYDVRRVIGRVSVKKVGGGMPIVCWWGNGANTHSGHLLGSVAGAG